MTEPTEDQEPEQAPEPEEEVELDQDVLDEAMDHAASGVGPEED